MAVKEAVVIRIEKKSIILLPIISPKCVTCHEKCLLRGGFFRAKNKKQFPLKKGNIVAVGTESTLENFLGVISLIIPVFCAFLGYFLFKNKAGEDIKALFSLLFLISSTLLLFILNRTLYRWYKPEILEVLS